MTFFLWAVPAVLFAAISKAGFGSGASFASAAILALALPPGEALGVMLPLLMLVDVAALKPYWRKWEPRSAKALLIGSVPGVALGAILYTIVPADGFRILIGLMCLVFVLFQGASSAGWIANQARPFSAKWGWVTGTFAGFTSFVSHAGGPPVALYLLGQRLSKTTYQATTVIVFWGINGLKFIPYAMLGIFTWQTFLADLILAPIALIGAWLGVRAHYWIPERAFFGLTYILLTITGIRLIWISVT